MGWLVYRLPMYELMCGLVTSAGLSVAPVTFVTYSLSAGFNPGIRLMSGLLMPDLLEW